MADIWTVAIVGIPAVVIAVVLLGLWWIYRDETKKNAKKIVRGSQAGLVLVAAFMLFTAFTVAPSGPGNVATARLTLSETATATCFDFPQFAGIDACNPATPTLDIVIDDNNKKVAVCLLTDYTANTMYACGSTTAFDKFGITFAVTRTDNGWFVPGSSTKPTTAVTFSISGLDAWTVKSNVTENDIKVVESDSQNVWQVAWEVGTADIVGFFNGGALCELAPSGGTCSVLLTVAFNEDALPRNIPFTNRPFSATVSIVMESGPTISVPIEFSLQSQA